MAQPSDTFDRRALHELARTRIDGLAGRFVICALGVAIGAIFVPFHWSALCLGLIAVTGFAEHRAARALLAADGPRTDAIDPPNASALPLFHTATAIAVALALGVIWEFTEPDAKVLPLSLLAIAVLDVALTGHQILRLMMLRQSIFLGTAVAMTLRDIKLSGGMTPQGLGAGLLPVLLLSAVVLSASHARARAFRAQLRHEHQLENARDAAEQTTARKSSFIATISHELRTQLNGVLGTAQNLLNATLSPAQREQAEVIAESGRSMNTLLNDILDYAKFESGNLTIDPAVEDLRGAIDHVARLYGPLAASEGLEFEVAIGPEIPGRLVFDMVRVRQCLSNLITNAIKFTETGSVRLALSGVVSGSAPNGAPRYLITAIVADTGMGIPEDHRDHLFQPFSQADDSIANRFGGTGLGLNITRQLAEAMGGSATLDSTSSAGSVFRLTFAADGTQDTDSSRSGDDAPNLTERRVLVADDIETNRTVLRLFLQHLGVEVVEVADGHAALEALAESRFDAALLDLNMPGMGGAEISARVRRGEAGRRDIPLLAVSADSGNSSVNIGADGFDAIIRKPIDQRALRSALSGAILRRAHEQSAQTEPSMRPGA